VTGVETSERLRHSEISVSKSLRSETRKGKQSMTSNPQSSEIVPTLNPFTGSTDFYRHPLGLVYTEGVKAMAEICKATWLFDVIVSWQAKCKKDSMLREIQLWTLQKGGDSRIGSPAETDSLRHSPAYTSQYD
jgi:uncharacterized protein DUF6876